MIDKGLINQLQINGKLKCLFDGWYLTSQVYSNEDHIEGINDYIFLLFAKHNFNFFLFKPYNR